MIALCLRQFSHGSVWLKFAYIAFPVVLGPADVGRDCSYGENG